MNARERLHGVAQSHPEWAPWLALIAVIVPELTRNAWDGSVPAPPRAAQTGEPLLSHARLTLDGALLSALAEALGRAAVRGEGSLFIALSALQPGAHDATALLIDAINGDGAAITRVASRTAADAQAVHAVASLLAMPFLHACRRRWEARIPTDWSRGYCPLCGAWPAFAEMRGVERSRHLRCGRCASAWAMPHLSCAYCGTRDHGMLACLVAEGEASTWAVETCNACRGYMKVLTTLRGTPPESVAIEDLAGVELDLAAAARGYRRPDAGGYRLCVTADDAAESAAMGV